MSKIKVMSEDLSNKIAAGEVVERTMNVVKELVENSIDAKSSMIKVELKDSGVLEITVTDEGIGMDKEEIKNTAEYSNPTEFLLAISSIKQVSSDCVEITFCDGPVFFIRFCLDSYLLFSVALYDTVDPAGTECVSQVLPPITQSSPITVSPPRMVAFAYMTT